MFDRHQRLFCGRGVRLFPGIATIESIDPASRVNQFLLAGEKRVTRRADFDVQIAFTRRTRLKSFATGASYCDFVIFGMNSGFHFSLTLYSRRYFVSFKQPIIRVAYTHRQAVVRSVMNHDPSIDNVTNRMLKVSFVRPVSNCINT